MKVYASKLLYTCGNYKEYKDTPYSIVSKGICF